MTAIHDLRIEMGKLSRAINEARAAIRTVDRPSRRKFGPPIEIKRAATTATQISGYGSVFGVRDSQNEIVERGAFARSIAKHTRDGTRPLMFWQHDPASPIGVWESFAEDDTGLWLEGRLLPAVRQAAEALALIEAGAIAGLSIGYRVFRDRKDQFSGVRHLLEIDLVEVSLVSLPSNARARIATGKEYDLREMKLALERMRFHLRGLT